MNEKYGIPEGQVALTEQEISKIGIKLGKSHRNEKDWDYIKDMLSGKVLFTSCPMDHQFARECSVEGVLKDGGYLMLFTTVDSCKEYLEKVRYRPFWRDDDYRHDSV